MPSSTPSWGWNDNDPIVNVSWNDAMAYCTWLSQQLSKTITLPTGTQWEFAARGGNQSNGYKYSGSNTLSTVGWYDENSNSKAHRVAQKNANELGVYDMSGNVGEWCLGTWSSTSTNRVLSGGSWRSGASRCSVESRLHSEPDRRFNFLGFRVVSNNQSTAQNYPTLIGVIGGTLGDIGNGTITVSNYSISKTEVTVAQYRDYCTATGTSMPWDTPSWGWNDNDPIVNVSWNDGNNYCTWLSQQLSKTITLPTEAQWEFAARGGNQSNGYTYSGSNTLSTVGWYYDNSNGKAHRVAQKNANGLGCTI